MVKDDGDMSISTKKWRGERAQYVGRYHQQGGDHYSEAFMKLMDDPDFLDAFEKNALLTFLINDGDQAETLFQASFRAA